MHSNSSTSVMTRSKQALIESKSYFPGGVNSPVRAFGAVGGTPPFIDKAEGAYIIDIDGNRYLDFVMSWGASILGHANNTVLKALATGLNSGTSFGAPTLIETKLAKLIQNFFPSLEKMRFVSSGTEACMSALRLARAFTNKKTIVKFKGCYHGHADSFLVSAGSGSATFNSPDSAGVTEDTVKDTLCLEYNNCEELSRILETKGDSLAAIFLEPIVGNAGFIRPSEDFIELLKKAQKSGVLIAFDEVMTGFRVAPGGVQELLSFRPDITMLGKVVGGGLPFAVYGARKDIMQSVSPDGPMYQAGTLSGNPLAVTAGIAVLETLEELRSQGAYKKAEQNLKWTLDAVENFAKERKLPFSFDIQGLMFGLYLSFRKSQDFEDQSQLEDKKFKSFFHSLLDQKVYIPASKFEACFFSFAHMEADFNRFEEALKQALVDCHEGIID